MRIASRSVSKSLKVLVIDVGGTKIKILATGKRTSRKVPSGPAMTAREMVKTVQQLAADWSYDAISVGYPGPVRDGIPVDEPKNLGSGWVGIRFRGCLLSPGQSDQRCGHAGAWQL